MYDAAALQCVRPVSPSAHRRRETVLQDSRPQQHIFSDRRNLYPDPAVRRLIEDDHDCMAHLAGGVGGSGVHPGILGQTETAARRILSGDGLDAGILLE